MDWRFGGTEVRHGSLTGWSWHGQAERSKGPQIGTRDHDPTTVTRLGPNRAVTLPWIEWGAQALVER